MAGSGLRTIRVVHVIPNLRPEGAQHVLLRLCAGTDREVGRRLEHRVVSLTDDAPLAADLERAGATVRTAGMAAGRLGPISSARLARLLRSAGADVVQTWLYHGDLVGGLAARSVGLPVVWGVHHTDLSGAGIKLSTRLVGHANRLLARWLPDRVVFCSEEGRRLHEAAGYPADRSVVIHNGFALPDIDVDRARRELRRELALDPASRIVGRVGRVHPQKDHPTFLDAAGEVARRHDDVRFVLCGAGAVWSNPELVGRIDALGLRERFRLLGVRRDIDHVHAAMDVAVSSSAYGEAHPLVVGEAMAVGVPAVVTDIGDSARLVGETGLVVPPGDPAALAGAVSRVLEWPPGEYRRRSRAARHRIGDRFGIDRMVRAYEQVYAEMAGTR